METTDALETLRADIQRVETTLTAEVQRVETTLTGEVQRVETTLSADIRRVETTLDARMRELNDDTRRHADVIFESLRDDIRMVAEGVVALSAKVDALTR